MKNTKKEDYLKAVRRKLEAKGMPEEALEAEMDKIAKEYDKNNIPADVVQKSKETLLEELKAENHRLKEENKNLKEDLLVLQTEVAKKELKCKECGKDVAENMIEHCQDCWDKEQKKPFCTQCSSKGVKHLKVCPTLKDKGSQSS